MASMYETSDLNAPTITNFKPEMIVLHRVIRKTLAPREGDSSRVPQFERNLLKAITEKTKFNVFASLFKRCGTLLSPITTHMLMLHT
jgi:hypothetical protein